MPYQCFGELKKICVELFIRWAPPYVIKGKMRTHELWSVGDDISMGPSQAAGPTLTATPGRGVTGPECGWKRLLYCVLSGMVQPRVLAPTGLATAVPFISQHF